MNPVRLKASPGFGKGPSHGRGSGIRKRVLAFVFLGVICLPALTHSRETVSPGFVSGEVLVGFREGVGEIPAERLHKRMGFKKKKGFKNLRLHQLEIPPGLSVEEAVALYQADPAVEFAEPNYIRRASAVPNDPEFGDQWGLNNTGQTIPLNLSTDLIGVYDADVDAPEGWDLVNFLSPPVDIVFALVDSGLDLFHPDLMNNVWVNPEEAAGTPGNDDDGNGLDDDINGWDFVDNGLSCNSACVCSGFPAGDNNPADEYGHGTSVAGVAAAEGNNGVGVSGVLWNSKIMALRILEKNGCGSTAAEIEAIDYAIFQLKQMQALTPTRMVMNASFGGLGFSQAEENALRRAGEAGILFVAAAGNETSDNDTLPVYPAAHKLSNVISVTATDASDRLAFFGNSGKNNVDLAAPGEFILTTATGTSCQSNFPPPPFTGYCFARGTSFSVPFVSGAAGLLLLQNPGLSPEEIRTILILTADPLPSLKGKVGSSGRLNIYSALTRREGSGLTGGDGGCGFPLKANGLGGGPPVPPASAGIFLVSLLWPLMMPLVRRLRKVRFRRGFPGGLGLVLVLFLFPGNPRPALAQYSLLEPGGGGYNYQAFRIKEGIHRFADSEFFDTNGGLISRNDLAGLTFEAEYEFRGWDFTGLTASIGTYSAKADLITVCCTDLTLSTVYLLGGGKFYPYFPFIRPAEWYFGGGLGLYYYRQELKGFLNDRISGLTIGVQGLTGFRIPFGKSLSGFAEFRYALAKIESADAFDDSLDIGGISYLFGLSWIIPPQPGLPGEVRRP